MPINLSGSLVLTGSLTSTLGFTGPLSGTASYSSNADMLDGLDSTVFTQTGSFNTFSSSILSYTSSANSRLNSIETVTGSNITRLNSLENKTGSYATTGSNTFIGTQTISGSIFGSGSLTINGCITSTGQIVAQTINVQQVTSSIVYSCGSNIFGTSISNTQQLTGSVGITGSLTIAGGSSATSYSGVTIFGSTITCSPIGCFTTSCATSFIGGTMSGTTIYGSTAVCSPVGKFTTCLDLGGALTGKTFAFSSSTNSDWAASIDNLGTTNANGLYVNIGASSTGVPFAVYKNFSELFKIANTGAATFNSSVTINKQNEGLILTSGTCTDASYLSTRANNGTGWLIMGSQGTTAGYIQSGTGANESAITTVGCYALTFGANQVERMRITSGGNVGINTSTPSSFGNYTNVTIKGGSSGANLDFFNSAGTRLVNFVLNGSISAYVGTVTDIPFDITQNDTTRLRVASCGNVGIGTTSPTYKLDVNADSIRFGDGGTATLHMNVPNNSGVSGNINVGGSPRITIQGTGNVGIGTSSPSELLDVRNAYREPTSGEFTQLLSSTTTQDAGRGGSLGFGGYYNGTSLFTTFSGIKGFKENGDGGNTAGALSFFTRTNGGALSERMRITSGGVVFIGASSIANSGFLLNVLGNPTSTIPLARYFVNGANTLSIPAIRFDKFDNDNTTSQVFIDFTINNQNSGSGSITANGASQATFTSWSDKRLKENITNLPSQLSNILALRPVEFDYKDGSGHQIGFIAQEVQEIYPDIVGKNAEGYLTISGLGKMESRLIKAIQEQQCTICSQASMINTLKTCLGIA